MVRRVKPAGVSGTLTWLPQTALVAEVIGVGWDMTECLCGWVGLVAESECLTTMAV